MAETSEDMFSRMSTNVSPTSEVKKVKKPKVKEAPVVETVQTKKTFCDKHPKMCMAGVKVGTAGVNAARKSKEVAKATYRGSVKAGKKVARGTYKAALVGTVVAEDVLSGDFAITDNIMKGYKSDLKDSEERYVSDYDDVRERLTGRKRNATVPKTSSTPKKRTTAKKKTATASRNTATAKKTTQARKSTAKKKTASKGKTTRRKSNNKRTSYVANPDYWRL